jgi:hypothetical protein
VGAKCNGAAAKIAITSPPTKAERRKRRTRRGTHYSKSAAVKRLKRFAVGGPSRRGVRGSFLPPAPVYLRRESGRSVCETRQQEEARQRSGDVLR